MQGEQGRYFVLEGRIQALEDMRLRHSDRFRRIEEIDLPPLRAFKSEVDGSRKAFKYLWWGWGIGVTTCITLMGFMFQQQTKSSNEQSSMRATIEAMKDQQQFIIDLIKGDRNGKHDLPHR